MKLALFGPKDRKRIPQITGFVSTVPLSFASKKSRFGVSGDR
jgi:hypothetical protein